MNRSFRLLRAYAHWQPEVSGSGRLECSCTQVHARFGATRTSPRADRPDGRHLYAAACSSTMSRVRAGSTLIPGPIVDANVTERM